MLRLSAQATVRRLPFAAGKRRGAVSARRFQGQGRRLRRQEPLAAGRGRRRTRSTRCRPAATVAPPRRAFPDGGYYVLGCDFDTPSEIRIVADAGPLGYLSIAAHGHADALAFTPVGGRRAVADRSRYLRLSHAAALARLLSRHRARTTRCASTGWISRSRAAISCGCARRRRAASNGHSGEEEDVFVGSHDGYLRLPDPVLHRRKISFDKRPAIAARGRQLRMQGRSPTGIQLAFRRRLRGAIERAHGLRVVRRCASLDDDAGLRLCAAGGARPGNAAAGVDLAAAG